MDIKLNLTLEEVNYLLNVLAERPYAEVAPLIDKIKNQGDEQVDSNSEVTN